MQVFEGSLASVLPIAISPQDASFECRVGTEQDAHAQLLQLVRRRSDPLGLVLYVHATRLADKCLQIDTRDMPDQAQNW